MEKHAERIREQLRVLADPARRESTKRFFKEDIKTYGVAGPDVKKIAKLAIKELKKAPKEDSFTLCDALWQSGYLEEGGVACEIAYSQRSAYTPDDFARFERWINNHVSNWASCDTLCNHSVGEFVQKYPEYIRELKQWASSPNRWKQRAAAVTLIIPARMGLFLEDIFDIATRLLPSQDDLVQKGYGWMLKAASEAHPEEVFKYLMEKRDSMPRTAFRYALEKLPKEKRDQAMKK